MIILKLPESVKIVLHQLETRGFEAFVVGGYVRDVLLGRTTHDCDVATNAQPDEIEHVFTEYKRSHFGKNHGTIGVKIDADWIEITTYRVDEAILDHRRPRTVRFSQHLQEDVLRRDFTMNALAMDTSGTVIDFVGGVNDLKNGLIRCVGDPELRFDEDALRILRALRFASQLNFKIEAKSVAAMNKHAALLKGLAVERIFQELQYIFTAKRPSLAFTFGQAVLTNIVPELNQIQPFEIAMLDELEDVFSKWVLCFRAYPLDVLRERLNRLKAPKHFIKTCVQLHACYHHRFEEEDYALKLMMHQYPRQILTMAMTMQMKLQDRFYDRSAHARLNSLIEQNVCVHVNALDLNGYDLMHHQIKGKQIQSLLEKALEGVMRNQVSNAKAELLRWLNLTS